jgi:hypothetical protein
VSVSEASRASGLTGANAVSGVDGGSEVNEVNGVSGLRHLRHILVLPDRDAAEEAAETLRDRFGVTEEPPLVRDALAGEDDAEDAQWLVVVEDPDGRLDAAELDAYAAEWDGWRET